MHDRDVPGQIVSSLRYRRQVVEAQAVNFGHEAVEPGVVRAHVLALASVAFGQAILVEAVEQGFLRLDTPALLKMDAIAAARRDDAVRSQFEPKTGLVS